MDKKDTAGWVITSSLASAIKIDTPSENDVKEYITDRKIRQKEERKI